MSDDKIRCGFVCEDPAQEDRFDYDVSWLALVILLAVPVAIALVWWAARHYGGPQ